MLHAPGLGGGLRTGHACAHPRPERRQLPPSRRRLSAGHTHCKAPDSLATPGVRRGGGPKSIPPPADPGRPARDGPLDPHSTPLLPPPQHQGVFEEDGDEGRSPRGQADSWNPEAPTWQKGMCKRGFPQAPHVGHPGTGKKKVKASQTPSRISTNSHWGQLAVMSSREKQLLSWGGGTCKEHVWTQRQRNGRRHALHVHSGGSCEAPLGLDGGNTE